jgi:hypothetical protein
MIPTIQILVSLLVVVAGRRERHTDRAEEYEARRQAIEVATAPPTILECTGEMLSAGLESDSPIPLGPQIRRSFLSPLVSQIYLA